MVEMQAVDLLFLLGCVFVGTSAFFHWLGRRGQEKLTDVYRSAAAMWEQRYFMLSEDFRRVLQGQPVVADEAEDWGSYVMDNATEVEIQGERNRTHVAGEIRLND